MNLYKRPMFMQQGGAATPRLPTPMANMPMARAPSGAMPPMRPSNAPMAPASRIPAAPPRPAAPDSQGIASMVADKAKADLATAQGPEQLINAFRGNQKPIAARYQELAEYVGPNDAGRTPTSVLTMVQPTIMMTEKGAADSGIGQLMAGVSGANAPVEGMGSGIMQQAPMRLSNGGSATLSELYEQQLPLFRQLTEASESEQALQRRAIPMAAVRAGLNLAQGAYGPQQNIASQLAGALQDFLPSLDAGREADIARERQAREAAIGSASDLYTAGVESQYNITEMEREAELERERLKLEAQLEGFDPDNLKRVRTSTGEIKNYDISNTTELAAYRAAVAAGGEDIGIEPLDPTDPSEMSMNAARGVFTDSALLDKLNDPNVTTIPAPELSRLNAAITFLTEPKRIDTGRTRPDGSRIFQDVAGGMIPDNFAQAIRNAQSRGIAVQTPLNEAVGLPEVQTNPLAAQYEERVSSATPLTAEQVNQIQTQLPSLSGPDDVDDPTYTEEIVSAYPITNAFGTWSALDRTYNTLGPAVLGIFGPQAAEFASPDQAEADAEAGLAAWKTLTIESMLAARGGRASDEQRRKLEEMFPTVNSALENRADALGKYNQIRGELQGELRRVDTYLQGGLTPTQRQELDFVKLQLLDRVKDLDAITAALRQGAAGATRQAPTELYEDVFQQLINTGDVSAPYLNTGSQPVPKP